MQFLERELKEHHSYARQNMYLLITWYTFFITLNFLAAGWFASEIHQIGHHGSIYAVIIYFIIQLVLSIMGCQFFKKYLKKTNKRVRKLNRKMKKGTKSPMPAKMYTSIITLFQITMYTLIALWVSFSAFIAWKDFSLYLF